MLWPPSNEPSSRVRHRRLRFDQLEDRRLLAIGDLDLDFGVAGYADIALLQGTGDEFGLRIESQQTVAGNKALVIALDSQSLVMLRLNTDGTVDETFGTGPDHSVNLTSLGLGGLRSSDIAIDGDSIYVLGSTGPNNFLKVARFDSDGILDNTFGIGGIADTGLRHFVTQDYYSLAEPSTSLLGKKPTAHLAVTPEGIVVAANSPVGQANNVDTVRLTRLRLTDQQVDTTFGDDGIAIAAQISNATGPGGFPFFPVLRELQFHNGRLFVLTSIFEGGDEFNDIFVVAASAITEFNSSGALVRQFDQHGQTLATLEPNRSAFDDFETLFLSAQGDQLVALGVTGSPDSDEAVALRRYNGDGTLDYSFGDTGNVIINAVAADGGSFDFDLPTGLSVQADGKLIVGGRTYFIGPEKTLRLHADGGLDSSFGGDGFVPATATSTVVSHCATVDSDGNVLILATPSNGPNGLEVEVSRLVGDLSFTPHQQAARVHGVGSVYRGERMAVTIGATDSSPAVEAAGFEYVIDWGDGSPTTTVPRTAGNGSGLNVEHVYTALGVFNVQVTATNINSEETSASTDIAVEFALLRNGTLLVGGTSGDDTITLSDDGGQIAVVVNGVSAGPFAGYGGVTVFLAGGADIIVADSVHVQLYGTAAPDNVTIQAGCTALVRLSAGTGNDTISANAMDTSTVEVSGEEGDDSIELLATDYAWAEASGGADNDEITGIASSAAHVSGYGDEGNDTISLTISNNATSGADGGGEDDQIDLSASDDSIIFGIVGGPGTDSISLLSTGTGGAVIDSTEGGDGEIDLITVNLGSLGGVVQVWNHDAVLDALTINGTTGDDVIHKTAGLVTLGDPVTESVSYFGTFSLTVDGGAGNDTITDPGEDTTILGGPGNDTIIIDATTGTGVFLDGGAGSDSYIILDGNLEGPVTVTDSGTTGTDTISFVAAETSTESVVEIVFEGASGQEATASLTAGNEITFDPAAFSFTAPASNTEPVEIEVGGAPVIVAPGTSVRPVQIDIRPGAVNTLNLDSNGVIAVAILSTAEFDARTVLASSVHFAGAGATQSKAQDVNGDGRLDLVLNFRTQDTTLRTLYAQLLADDVNADGILDSSHQTASVSLTGETVDQVLIEGFDNLDLFLAGKSLRTLLDQLAAAGAI